MKEKENRYKKWTIEDDNLLFTLYHEKNMLISEIASKLQRTESSILYRIQSHHRVK